MKKTEVRSDKELQLDLMLFVLFLCFYAYMVGVTFGQLRERSRLLNLREAVRDNSLEGVHYFSSDEEGLENAARFVESLKSSARSQKSHKTSHLKKETINERPRPDKPGPDHTH